MSLISDSSPEIVLASASASRAALIQAAGIPVRINPADIDEAEIRSVLEKGGKMLPEDVAEVLARTKAETVSLRETSALTIGADQILELAGRIYEKPRSMKEARAALLRLSGHTHHLHSSVAVARGGETLWSYTGTAHMTMRNFDAVFIGNYLAETGDAILSSVGAYHLEGLGVHLFEKIEGDYFTILGLPLMPLLECLRREGVLRT